MSELDVQISSAFDPFAEANAEDSSAGTKEYVHDPELGQVIQLQGDQRKNVSTFLVQACIVKKENIKIHGF
ncbi:hypothetical protein Vadar_029184 [Vaccinium darrowii]|uniref:Uncharacterized protein n=1 Tax=Vaccinium darrowii TaxID=229202 RepID=A0ACB7XVH3_9ERIC|nr:hypothetical protein Vadar_029184 [Vaccinium darrowii]